MMRKCRAIILFLSINTILMSEAKNIYDCQNKMAAIKFMSNSTPKIQKLNINEGRMMAVHNPITCDGYILTIFRLISVGNRPLPTESPVLLVHGMFQSSDRFLRQTTDKSLAYKLQDLGYDVWVFNARGNKYCRQNINLKSECDEKQEFFNYSFEEIGLLDVAATVDYILNVSEYKKIQFIGHSLGATHFLVLNSLRPDYNALFDRAFLLAPFAYHHHFVHGALKREFTNFKPNELLEEDIVEIFPYKCIRSQEFLYEPEDCLKEIKYKSICNYLDLQNIMGLNRDKNTISDTRGGSVKQLAHFAQNVVSGDFRRYDFPIDSDNTKSYGVGHPPEYDLSLITVPTMVYYSTADEYVHYRDIEKLVSKMGNATAVKVAKMEFKHDDFVNSSHAMYYVYTSIIRSLPKYSDPKDTSTLDKGRFAQNTRILIWVLIVIAASLCICLCLCIFNSVTAE